MKKEQTINLDLEEKFPHLEAAPIVEAVIQWVARAGNSFSPPEELRRQLLEKLPEYPDHQAQVKLELEGQLALDGGSSTQKGHAGWHGFSLTSSDKRQVTQITRDGVVFSRLAPYQNWHAFSSEGLRLWKAFVELAAPSEVQRLSIRYINRMPTVDLVKLGDYLSQPPKCLEPLGMPMSNFFYQSLHEVPDYPFQINIVQTVQPPAPSQIKEFGIILDISVVTTRAFVPTDQILEDFLPKMRWLKNKAFFSLISERAIRLFRETNNG